MSLAADEMIIGHTFTSRSGDRTIKVLKKAQAPLAADAASSYEVEVLAHIFPSRIGRKTFVSDTTLIKNYLTS